MASGISKGLKRECLKRSIRMYRIWIREGRIKLDDAEHEIAVLREIKDDYTPDVVVAYLSEPPA